MKKLFILVLLPFTLLIFCGPKAPTGACVVITEDHDPEDWNNNIREYGSVYSEFCYEDEIEDDCDEEDARSVTDSSTGNTYIRVDTPKFHEGKRCQDYDYPYDCGDKFAYDKAECEY